MKSILLISANKILGQGLLEAILSKTELGFQWTAQLNYSQAIIGAESVALHY